jgi:tetratricopeptide (TPR) repeat protein
LFIAALIWIRGLSFFNLSFLGRMAAAGLAGLSLYLLLPLVVAFSDVDFLNFWSALKTNLGFQKATLLGFPRKTLLVLMLTSLLPVLLISIRWSSNFGDFSKLGSFLTTWILHAAQLGILFACIWTAFDPPSSPRERGMGFAFLPFYYLGALSVGYFSGYFLVVFREITKRGHRTPPVFKTLNNALSAGLLVLTALVPLGLLLKNTILIQTINGPALKNFATASSEGLPKSGAILSDEPRRLLLVRSWLARENRHKDYIFIDTQALRWPGYHNYLNKRYPQQWSPAPEQAVEKTEDSADERKVLQVDSRTIIKGILNLSTNGEVAYLHPSFGYYFEFFYTEPRGLAFLLKRYDAGMVLPPKIPEQVYRENESFWERTTENFLKPLARQIAPSAPESAPTLRTRLLQALHISEEVIHQSKSLGQNCSRSLNQWAVETQKHGNLDKAAAYFELAQQLNPDNIVAQINNSYNKNLRAGITTPVLPPKGISEVLEKYRWSWDQLVGLNGTFDEPALCYAQGWAFTQNRLFHQAAQYFDRVSQLSRDDFGSRLSLAQIYLFINRPTEALELVAEIRNQPERFKLSSTNLNGVITVEATAWYVKKEPEKAKEVFDAAIKKSPSDIHLLSTVATVYTQQGDYTNALSIVDRLIQINPGSPVALIARGTIFVYLKDFNKAVEIFSDVLSREPANVPARLNRAIAFLQAGKLEESRQDYQALEKSPIQNPTLYQVQYGLGEIAWKQQDTESALRHYEAYLTNAPISVESRLVSERLKRLKEEKVN